MRITSKNMLKFFEIMLSKFRNLIFSFGHPTQHGELPPLGTEPMPSAMEARSLNHWITREVQESVLNNMS